MVFKQEPRYGRAEPLVEKSSQEGDAPQSHECRNPKTALKSEGIDEEKFEYRDCQQSQTCLPDYPPSLDDAQDEREAGIDRPQQA